MRKYPKRGPRRKTLTRLKLIATIGSRRRRPWTRPFVTSVFKVERLTLGATA
jgi:hypothetical protein